MQNKFSSVKSLCDRLNISSVEANLIRSLIKGDTSPEQYEVVQKWVNSCYNKPSRVELVMCAINEILGGFGSEAIFVSRITQPDISYINLGDTYIPTICYDHNKHRFLVACWGDLAEKLPLND